MEQTGNVSEVVDETRPAYDFTELSQIYEGGSLGNMWIVLREVKIRWSRKLCFTGLKPCWMRRGSYEIKRVKPEEFRKIP